MGMLLFYDWKLALLSMIFPPISYFIAEKMKVIQKTGAAYKKQSEAGISTTGFQCNHLPGVLGGEHVSGKRLMRGKSSAYERAGSS